MTHYRLTYFDIDGGRAEHIRIALHAAGIAFEDDRISFQQFQDRRSSLPFSCIPVLEIDGRPVTQSNAIGRYVGKLGGLYPEDALQALYCDEVLGTLEDLTNRVVRTFGLEGEALERARKELTDGWLSLYLRGLGELLTRGGGEYFASGQMTVADLRAFAQIRALRSGVLDHIPEDVVDTVAPGLVSLQERVADDPRVVAWYESRKAT